MNEYELMVILHPRLTADETATALASIEAQITGQAGELLTTDVWGRRRLAYPINGSMDGTYVLFTLKMPAAGASPLEAWLVITDPVIRHLLIRGIIPYQGRDRNDDDRDRDRDRDDRYDRDDGRDHRDDRGERGDRAEMSDMDMPAAETSSPEAVAADE